MNMLNKLRIERPVLLDGALGTEMQKYGMEAGKSTISQNLERPELLIKIHKSYIDAGSQMFSANTFAGNIGILEKAGLSSQEVELNIQGMKLARQASAGKALIGADIGPTGEFYTVSFDSKKVKEIYIRQTRILIQEPPDFFYLETFFDLREALCALEGVKEACGNIPVAASMTFNRNKRGFFTMMGDKAVDSLKTLQSAGADAVGSNCTLTPPDMLDLLKEVRDKVDVPLLMQPNAGQPEIVDGNIVYKIDPREFAEGLAKLAENGAEVVGGCCGSTPEMMGMADKLVHKQPSTQAIKYSR